MAAALLLPVGAQSQPSGGDIGFDAVAPRPVAVAPMLEGGLRKNRGINIAANLKVAPAQQLSIGYTASNSYTNPGLLTCHERTCRLSYESDHVGNLYFLSYSQPFLARFELAFTLGSYRLEQPELGLVEALVGDRSLRRFHEKVLQEDSLPSMSGAQDDRQLFSMTDLEGRSLTLWPERDYALPLRVDLTRYMSLKSGPSSRIDLNVGLHLAYPLEGDVAPGRGEFALARGLDIGLSINLVRVKQLTANVSSTWHLQLARFRSDVTVVNPNSPLNGDDRLRSQYALTYGLRFGRTFNGTAPCSFALSHLSNSAHYDKQTYYAYDPVVFAGGNNIRGALAGANDYGAIHFGCEYKRRHYQISLVEDIAGVSQFIGDDGAGTSYDPDFALGLSATWALPSRRGN